MKITNFNNLKQITYNLTRWTNLKMATTTNSVSSFRDRPFIVICGCTGTGKTKLSIQLAEWLIKNKQHAEIINADAMQVNEQT